MLPKEHARERDSLSGRFSEQKLLTSPLKHSASLSIQGDCAYTALYYPHTRFRDIGLLKTALLLWDKLEFIVPWDDFDLRSNFNNDEVNEGMEVIGVGLRPSYEQMALAHEAVEDLATSPLPKDYLLENLHEDNQYLIYPQKFLRKLANSRRDGLGNSKVCW